MCLFVARARRRLPGGFCSARGGASRPRPSLRESAMISVQSRRSPMVSSRAVRILILSLLVPAAPLLAQQTGAIRGTVTDSQGGALPGVTVEASSNVLPVPRVTVTEGDGE